MDLEKVKDSRVLLIGDAIIDEYRYVRVLGKAAKEIALSVMFESKQTFDGGVWATAEHIKHFCATVHTMTGDKVMVNSRQIESAHMRKLLVEHSLKDLVEERRSYDIRDYDCVIVNDFGHGAMTKALIEKVIKEARFLAVNVQANATNYGFNLITKYRRADFVVLDELEARLAAHDNEADIEDVILKLGYRNIIVTMGKLGAVGFDGVFERQKALTDTVVDTMGAGDAFLGVTAPFAAAGVPMRDLIRIGNAAAAVKCGIVGHRASVTKEALQRYLSS